MKKIAIILLVLGIALSYSCKKEEGKEVSTTISGQLRTNGTQDPIMVSVEIDNPIITIYHEIDQVGHTSTGFEKVSSTIVDNYGNFSITLDLNSNGGYFIGVSNLETRLYYEGIPSDWWHITMVNNILDPISPGSNNNYVVYIRAISYAYYRMINSNTSSNNDVFDCPTWGVSFTGPTDSILTWLDKTWGGTYRNGIVNNDLAHKVIGKLTRNGVTRDTSIIYTVPPFDTTIVEIRY